MDSTTQVRFKTTAPEPGVIVKAFNSRGHGWKCSALSWLDDKRNDRLGLVEGHSLEIRSGCCCQEYVLLVVEKTLTPIRPLPPKIYFAHWELEAWSGHHISICCDTSPPEITILHDFWECSAGEGKTPHFEHHVQPVIDGLVASFEEESWAS